MLTLAQASGFFDRTPIEDPDTSRVVAYGQVDPYSDAARDSATAYRRILSVAPGTALPASRVVRIMGKVWIVGESQIDGLAEAHRVKYVLHPSFGKAAVYTLAGYLTTTSSYSAWMAVSWFKDAKEDTVTSRAIPMFTVYSPADRTLPEYSVVVDSSGAYMTQVSHPAVSGMQESTAVRLEFQPVNITLSTRVYDPVAGGYGTTTPATVKCLRIRWQSLYMYRDQADAKYAEGDDAFVLPAGTTLATKDTLTVAGKTWAVVSVETIGGAVVAHGRPA